MFALVIIFICSINLIFARSHHKYDYSSKHHVSSDHEKSHPLESSSQLNEKKVEMPVEKTRYELEIEAAMQKESQMADLQRARDPQEIISGGFLEEQQQQQPKQEIQQENAAQMPIAEQQAMQIMIEQQQQKQDVVFEELKEAIVPELEKVKELVESVNMIEGIREGQEKTTKKFKSKSKSNSFHRNPQEGFGDFGNMVYKTETTNGGEQENGFRPKKYNSLMKQLTGTWQNELGSVVELIASKSGNIIGEYMSKVGKVNGTYSLIGLYDTDSSIEYTTVGFIVSWSNSNMNAHSLASWNGFYSNQTLNMFWVLSSTPKNSDDIWSAQRIGKDVFTKTIKK